MLVNARWQPGKVTLILLAITVFLVAASLWGQYSTYFLNDGHLQGFVPEFNLDREMNVPTWFSSSCFLFAASLLWKLAGREPQTAGKYWRGLALVFVYLSLDETAAIHEMAVEPMRRLFNTHGLLYFAWVIPGAAFVAVLAMLYGRFFLSQARRVRRWFIASAAVFLLGTLGMEMVGGRYVEAYGTNTFDYALIANAEETLELLGLVLLIHALMVLLKKNQEEIANKK